MTQRSAILIIFILAFVAVGVAVYLDRYQPTQAPELSLEQQVENEKWKDKLTPMQYKVTRLKGTERAFTGEYWNHKEDGIYKCVCCGQPLFDSQTKYKSGTGWPSFYDLISPDGIKSEADGSLPYEMRTEVICSKCDAHLGHVFPDGPDPTGLRYCINSAALDFQKRDSQAD